MGIPEPFSLLLVLRGIDNHKYLFNTDIDLEQDTLEMDQGYYWKFRLIFMGPLPLGLDYNIICRTELWNLRKRGNVIWPEQLQ